MSDDTPIAALHQRINALPAKARLEAWERIKHIAASGVERQRHQQFAHLRITGEWFRYDGDLLSHVQALTSD